MPAGMRHDWRKNSLDARGTQGAQVITGYRLGPPLCLTLAGRVVDSAGYPPMSRPLGITLGLLATPVALGQKRSFGKADMM